MAANSRVFDNDPKNNLGGFSSNKAWASPEAQWSDSPAIEGPKDGFHDPVDAAPARKQLWQGGSESAAEDASVSLSLGGGTLG